LQGEQPPKLVTCIALQVNAFPFQPFYIVMELVNGNSVDKYLKKEGKNIDNKTRLRILIDGSKGMKYLHSQNPPFLHLDFAARNLLINWTSTLFKTRQNMVTKVGQTHQWIC
jgi:serine/threonine protein kinase